MHTCIHVYKHLNNCLHRYTHLADTHPPRDLVKRPHNKKTKQKRGRLFLGSACGCCKNVSKSLTLIFSKFDLANTLPLRFSDLICSHILLNICSANNNSSCGFSMPCAANESWVWSLCPELLWLNLWLFTAPQELSRNSPPLFVVVTMLAFRLFAFSLFRVPLKCECVL